MLRDRESSIGLLVSVSHLFFCFVELQPVFTAEPPNPFLVLEGNNISLEWSYDLGVGGSFRRIEFSQITSAPTILILEVNSPGEYPVNQTPVHLDHRYNGRLQANMTDKRTSITILEANRTVDSKRYQFEVVQLGHSSVGSLVTISVQCK
jgi:hypothetical protein